MIKPLFLVLSSIALILPMGNQVLLSQQAVNWKPYFTLHPDEGTYWKIDSLPVPIQPNTGLPGLNITNDNRVLLGYAGATDGRGAAIVTGNGTGYIVINDSTSRPKEVDGGFIYLPDGRTRFLAEERSPTWTREKQRIHIVSYISDDGINWTKESGIRYQPGIADDSISNLPAAIQIKDSLWRLYYCADFYGTLPNTTRTALSYDWGVTWISESNGSILRSGDVDPHPMYLTNGKIRLYYRYGFGKPPAEAGIGYCDSDDGLHFDTTAAHYCFRDADFPAGRKLDPAVIKFPDGSVVCYFGGERAGNIVLMAARGASVNSVGEAPSMQDFLLSPNPSSGQTTLSFSTLRAIECSVIVSDILGRVVFRKVVTSVSGANAIELPRFTSGVYMVRLDADTSMTTHLFITE